jgi:thymidine phosphorylase
VTTPNNHSAAEIIAAKRDKKELTNEQIQWVLDSYVSGAVAHEQMSALSMAIFLNGMSTREITKWTQVMAESGTRMNWSGLGKPTVDKHSTGGVGDKITLILTPLVASCGAAVPQLSGRGLGHTGGTLDKLEAIKGWQANISPERMFEILESVGGVICAAGADLAPADRLLYSLRDVTSTVESIPLIASSIMSKKIAEGTGALVLDVKVGAGAFMKTEAQARELARTMVDIGNKSGVNTVAFLTAMDVPLGRTAGHSLEVEEAVEVLSGSGPSDVRELTLVLAKEMLELVGMGNVDAAEALDSGRALETWHQMIRAQGGDPVAPLPKAPIAHEIKAETDGVVTKLDAMGIGVSAWRLGAGRARKEDSVSQSAGVRWHFGLGERVSAGQVLATLYTEDASRLPSALAAIEPAIAVGKASDVTQGLPLVLEKVK